MRRGIGGRELQGKRCPEQKWGEDKVKGQCDQEQAVQSGWKQMLGALRARRDLS